MLFEVFGDQAALAVVRRFLTAKQTSAVQEFARGVFDVPGTHQSEKVAPVQWRVGRRGEKQAEPRGPHPGATFTSVMDEQTRLKSRVPDSHLARHLTMNRGASMPSLSYT